jgi:predicted nucleic acid-binding protein
MTLVDSSVLIDLFTNDPVWYRWSAERLDQRAQVGALLVNEIVYAELSVRMASEAELLRRLATFNVELVRTPTQALFIAGKTYSRYRAAGGLRTGVLPDFFIGAHASFAGIPLFTRDVRRFRTYFPDVELIAPTV